MILETLVVGALAVNCYLLGCERTREAAVIDPGGDAAAILEALEKARLRPRWLILTHGHFDHFGAVRELQDRTGAAVLLGERDAPLLGEVAAQAATFRMPPVPPPREFRTVREGDVIEVGDLRLRVIETPGHTPGGISLHLPEEGVVFTGDTLFWGAVGRTDLPGGDMLTLVGSLKTKLGSLPDETRVLPGHEEETSIGLEKEQNPFFE